MTLRVLVAEDNLLVREGIMKLLEHVRGDEVVGACSTYDELLAAADADTPDVVLTDIRMPPTGTDEGIRGRPCPARVASGNRRRRAQPVRRARVRGRAASTKAPTGAATC